MQKYPQEYHDLKNLINHPWFKYYVERISGEMEILKEKIMKIDFTWKSNEKAYSSYDLHKVRFSVLSKMITEPQILIRSFDVEIIEERENEDNVEVYIPEYTDEEVK